MFLTKVSVIYTASFVIIPDVGLSGLVELTGNDPDSILKTLNPYILPFDPSYLEIFHRFGLFVTRGMCVFVDYVF